jgi:biotin carboxyl carrier protein
VVPLTLLGAACKRAEPVQAPILAPAERSQITPEVHTVIDALRTGAVEPVATWMTPELRGRVPLRDLDAASHRLREQFGTPVGILEEHTHREGDLQWYSGLVAFRRWTPEGSQVAPILVQFATDSQQRLARLLIREHWFIDKVDPPAEAYVPVTRFHFPARGTWYVLHGGRNRSTNYHHGHSGQRFAYDLVVKHNGRQRPPGAPKVNASYYTHGKELLAPAGGTVVKAINDVPENAPGERGRAGGNGVVIDHGFGEFSSMWHAIPGSVRVKVGDRVENGQVIAKAGNSGRSSGPHVHFHVSHRTGKRGENERFGLPAPFVDVYVEDRWYPQKMPVRGQYVRRSDEDKRTAALTSAPRVYLDL